MRAGLVLLFVLGAISAVLAALPAPATLTVTPYSSNGLTVQWGTVGLATGYKIFYGVGSATMVYPSNDRLIFGTTVTVLTGLLPSTTYVVYVAAFSGAEQGASSVTRTVSTLAASGAPDSYGTSFTVAFPHNRGTTGLPSLHITPLRSSGTVSITLSNLPPTTTLPLTAGVTTVFNVSNSALYSASDAMSTVSMRKSIKITSTVEIAVRGLNWQSQTGDSFVAYPDDVQGTDYVISGFPGASSTETSMVLLTAIEDNTLMWITTSAATTRGSANPVNSVFLITLQKQFQYAMEAAALGDFTGSTIFSNKPIVVTVSAACSKIPTTAQSCDMILEQLLPVVTWDKTYVVTALSERSSGDTVRIVSSPATTTSVSVTNLGTGTVTTNSLAANSFLELALPSSDNGLLISATQPVHVMQYSRSGSVDNKNYADPSSITVPGQKQWMPRYVLSPITTEYTRYTDWVNLVARTTQSAGIRFNGSPLTWTSLGATYSMARFTLPAGYQSYVVEHNDPNVVFGAVQYGYGRNETYGMVGGLRAAPLNLQCYVQTGVPGDGYDNDCDGVIDEELPNGVDDDSDGTIDEDLAGLICCGQITVAATVFAECGVALPSSAVYSDVCNTQALSPVTFVDNAPTSTGCGNTNVHTRVYSARSFCGDTVTVTQVVTVVDTTQPTLAIANPTMSLQCTADVDVSPFGLAGSPTTTDTCGVSTLNAYVDTVTTGCGSSRTIQRLWKATDACGNTNTLVQEITVADTIAPQFDEFPADAVVECTGGVVDIAPAITGTPTGFDTCGSVTASHVDSESSSAFPGQCGNGYRITRTWTLTDSCGNTNTGTQLISVIDTVDPTWTHFPADATVECSAAPDVSATLLGTATASDACGSVTVTFVDSNHETSGGGHCGLSYSFARTWTAVDACGHSIQRVQQITLEDTTNPVWDSFPADQTVECSSVADISSTTLGRPTAFDTCGVVTIVSDDGAPMTDYEGHCGLASRFERTWTATDACGHSITSVQLITYVDTTAPTFDNNLTDVEIECSSDLTFAPAITGLPTGADACNDVTLSFTDSPHSTSFAGQCGSTLQFTRTWTVSDGCGHSAVQTQLITTLDRTSPEWTEFPANAVVECVAGAIITPDVVGTPIASDACDQVTYASSDSEPETASFVACGNEHRIHRTWTAADGCSHSIARNQLITLRDTVAPSFTYFPIDYVVECAAVVDTSVAQAGVPIPVDDCGTVSMTHADTPHSTSYEGQCGQTYQFLRVWSIEDQCGHSFSQTQTITLVDTTPPVFVDVPNVDVNCGDAYTPEDLGVLEAVDSCGSATVGIPTDALVGPGSCGGETIIRRTWTATDECGQATTADQTITFHDVEAPSVTFPATWTTSCSAVDISEASAGSPEATDSCGIPTSSYLDGESVAGCNSASSSFTRTWTVTDGCLSSVGTQFIEIVDDSAPVVTAPAPTTFECTGLITDIAATTQPSAVDTCVAPENLIVSSAEGSAFVTCGNAFTLTRTWYVSDGCQTGSATQLVTVEDTSAPTIVFDQVAQSLTINCGDDSSVEALGTPSAMDTCGSAVIVGHEDITAPVEGQCGAETTILRTWTAQDDCMNTVTAVQTITIVDHVNPIFDTFPSTVQRECVSGDLSATETGAGFPTGLDLCNPSVDVQFVNDVTTPSCGNSVTIVRTFSVSDSCQSITQTQIIQVQDTVAPVITFAPGTQTISFECGEDTEPTVANTPTAADSCGSANLNHEDSVHLPGSCGGGYVILRTWSSVDDCDNTATEIQTITVVDTTAPTISLAGIEAITVTCGESTDSIAENTPTASDSCSVVSVTPSDTVTAGSCGAETVITRVWTAVDGCNNAVTATQIITVVDNVAPSFTGDFSVEYHANCASLDIDPATTGLPVGADACNANLQEATYVDGPHTLLCGASYSFVRTWTITDGCQSATLDQTIFVGDAVAPVITTPADTSVECVGITTDVLPSVTGVATAHDECSGLDVTPTSTDSVVLTDGCSGAYVIVRTWSATDGCNEGSTTQTITVVDSALPSIEFTEAVPQNLAVECTGDSSPEVLGFPNAADACSVASLQAHSDTIVAGDCGAESVITRTWTAVDQCDHSVTAEQTITLVDTIAPTFSFFPADATFECGTTFDMSATEAGVGVAIGGDSCNPDVTVSVVGEQIVAGCTANVYAIARTWKVSDGCVPHDYSRVQAITIRDTTAPTIVFSESAPQVLTVECSLGDTTPNGPAGTPTAIDSCGGASITGHVDTFLAGACAADTVIVRTWTAVDDCYNTITAEQTITVADSVAPSFVGDFPEDIHVECANLPDLTDSTILSVADNCVASPTFLGYTDSQGAFTCGAAYTINRAWAVTDGCNTHTQIQTIFVDDSTLPFILAPVDYTAVCGGDEDVSPAVAGYPTVSDTCKTDVVAEFEDSPVNSEMAMFICGNGYNFQRVWSVDDGCNEVQTSVQNIAIADSTPPTFTTFPADYTTECQIGVEYDLSVATTGGEPTGADTCGLVTVSFVDQPHQLVCGLSFQFARRWILTDECGLTTTQDQTITVADTTLPTVATFPADYTVECSLYDIVDTSVAVAGTPTGSDTCNEVVTTSSADSANQYVCGRAYNVERTWTFSDGCNSITQIQTIVVQDSFMPTLVAPADVTLECSEDVSTDPAITGQATGTDSCNDQMGDMFGAVPFYDSVADEIAQLLCGNEFLFVRTWVLDDGCNMEESAAQVITVLDTTAPSFTSMPSEYVTECTGGLIDLSVAVTGEPVAADNCGSVTVEHEDEPVAQLCSSGYTFNRVWKATDECGITHTEIQTITVSDTVAPSFNVFPDDIHVECEFAWTVFPEANFGIPTAIDVCNANPVVTGYADSTVAGCGGSYHVVRTWSVNDECNTYTQDQTIFVDDTSMPSLTPPADFVVECSANVVVDPSLTGLPVISDVCSGPNLGEASFYDEITPNIAEVECGNQYSFVRTWHIDDGCGNEMSDIQIIQALDNTAPSWSFFPEDYEVECDGALLDTSVATAGEAIGMDDCGTTTVEYHDMPTSATCGGTSTFTRVWTVLDQCGWSATRNQQVSIIDTTAPVFDGVLPAYTTECNSAYVDITPETAGIPSGTDACGEVTVVGHADGASTTVCGAAKTFTRTWTLSDGCNTATQDQLFVIQDTTMPTILAPASYTAECYPSLNPDPTITGFPVVSDDCNDNMPAPTYFDDLSGQIEAGGCGGSFSFVRTWIADDGCTEQNWDVQWFSIVDTSAPTFSAFPSDFTAECTENTDISPAVAGEPTAYDDCSNVVVTHEDSTSTAGCGNTYSFVRTWTATDACGFTFSQTQNIIVEDHTNPSFNDFPVNAQVECGEGGSVPVFEGDDLPLPDILPPGDTTPTATGIPTPYDSCAVSTMSHTDGASTTAYAGQCGATSRFVRTWHVEDQCGNSFDQEQTISIVDTLAPSFDVFPPHTTVECMSNPDLSATALGEPSAVDSCGALSVSITFVDEPSTTDYDGHCGNNYRFTRVWTATDVCGNTISQEQTVHLVDNYPPWFVTFPATATVSCSLHSVDAVHTGGEPTGDDDCGPVYITSVDSAPSGDFAGQCGTAAEFTRTWTVSDGCGHSVSQDQQVFVIDDQAPTFTTFPEHAFVECGGLPVRRRLLDEEDDGAPEGEIPYVHPGGNTASSVTGEPTVADGCGSSVTVTSEDSALTTVYPQQCGGSSRFTRTWTIVDACDNSASADQVISYVDTILPTFMTFPEDVSVECNPSADISVETLGEPTGYDSCSGFAITYEDSAADMAYPGQCGGENMIVRMWTITDACGNRFQESQLITMIDTTVPVVVAPSDITLECGEDTSISGSAGDATVADTCSAIHTSHADVLSPSCGVAQSIVRTFSAYDDCDNSNSDSQIITVADTTAPVLLVPQNYVDLTCGADVSISARGSATASDACQGSLTPTSTESYVAGCAGTGTTLRTWTVTDGCTAPVSIVQTIIVVDNSAPVITAPADIAVECGQLLDPETLTGVPTTSDDCGIDASSISYTDVSAAGECPVSSIVTRTWSVVDLCGHTSTADQIITITDTTLPETAAEPICVRESTDEWYCWDTIQTNNDFIAASDSCSAVTRTIVSCTANEALDPWLSNSNFLETCKVDILNRLCVKAEHGVDIDRMYTLTYSIQDECGNQVNNLEQTVTVPRVPSALCINANTGSATRRLLEVDAAEAEAEFIATQQAEQALIAQQQRALAGNWLAGYSMGAVAAVCLVAVLLGVGLSLFAARMCKRSSVTSTELL